MSIRMQKFPSCFAGGKNQVIWIALAQDCQSVFIFPLSDLTVGSQISTGRAVAKKVMFFQECEGASIIAYGEMNLSEEEGIIGVICSYSAGLQENGEGIGYW